mmetsp:Transcript_15845/g.45333  ORF Transcript_15845/g.45333 Transcript_15845/m.45333 type:complete len:261 (+) Transcript_15845:914-1696(+)
MRQGVANVPEAIRLVCSFGRHRPCLYGIARARGIGTLGPPRLWLFLTSSVLYGVYDGVWNFPNPAREAHGRHCRQCRRRQGHRLDPQLSFQGLAILLRFTGVSHTALLPRPSQIHQTSGTVHGIEAAEEGRQRIRGLEQRVLDEDGPTPALGVPDLFRIDRALRRLAHAQRHLFGDVWRRDSSNFRQKWASPERGRYTHVRAHLVARIVFSHDSRAPSLPRETGEGPGMVLTKYLFLVAKRVTSFDSRSCCRRLVHVSQT